MSSRTLYRLCGGTLIVGSLLILISSVVSAILYLGHNANPQQLVSSTYLIVTLLNIIGSLLFVIGLPGMYLRQAGRAGVLGLISFILLFFGILLDGIVFANMQALILPWLAQKAPQLTEGKSIPLSLILLLLISGFMEIIGSIVLGIATLRAHVFPRWAGIFLLIYGIAFLLNGSFPSPLSDIFEIVSSFGFALAFFWCGYLLLMRQDETVEAVTRPAAEVGASQ
jgi:hypothetical protein